MNNKGFSLIEILVTVGLIGILVSVAVPSYRNYKRNTIKMAMRAEVGNGQKAYGAKYAVDSSYCYNLEEVGMDTDRKNSPIFKNKGFFGFGAGTAAPDLCDVSALGGLDTLQFISDGEGKCSGGSSSGNEKTKTECDGASPNAGTWTVHSGTAGVNAANCKIGTNTFIIGAYSDVSSLDTIIQANEKGQVVEIPKVKDCNDAKF